MGGYGYVILWLVLAIAFVVAEAMTSQLVGIWFAVGSIVGLIFGFIKAPEWLQFIAFAVSSAILLAATRPLVHKYLSGKTIATNSDRAIGKTALVVADITPDAPGQAKVNGLTWTAVSTYNDLIPKGAHVIVHAIEGVKLVVEPIKEKVEV